MVLRIFISVAVILVCYACNNNLHSVTSQRPVLRILGAGKPAVDYDILNLLAKKYRVSYELVGGCTETKEFMDSIHNYNEKNYVILNKEFGANWEKQLDIELDSITGLINKAEKIINTQTNYKQCAKEFEDNGKIIGLWIEPTEANYIFLAQSYFYEDYDKKDIYEEWRVDLKNWKIIDTLLSSNVSQ